MCLDVGDHLVGPLGQAERLADEPLLLRMPLVRFQQRLTVGDGEAAWREWTAR